MCDYQLRSQGPLLPVPAERETGTGSREDPRGTRSVRPPLVSDLLSEISLVLFAWKMSLAALVSNREHFFEAT